MKRGSGINRSLCPVTSKPSGDGQNGRGGRPVPATPDHSTTPPFGAHPLRKAAEDRGVVSIGKLIEKLSKPCGFEKWKYEAHLARVIGSADEVKTLDSRTVVPPDLGNAKRCVTGLS